MKILVTAKEVASVDDDFQIEGLAVPPEYVTADLNEWDEYAVEEAVQISETLDDVEVVSVTVGSSETEETIRQVLAKGADRAVRVWDDTLAGADVLDPATKADVLAGVVRREEPDLILTGVQSGDDGFAATGVSLAERLGWEWAAVVNELDLRVDDGEAHVHRELEGGVEELTDIELPAVLTIQTGINDPRYASLRGIRQAQQKEIDELTLADLDLDPGVVDSALTVTGMREPEKERDVTVFEGDAEAVAADLAGALRDMGVGQ